MVRLGLAAILIGLVGAVGAETAPQAAPRAPRIVSFAPAATECLFFVGLGELVVGRSPYCDEPPEAKALPVVGDVSAFDEAALARLAPTHAVVSSKNHPVVPYLTALGAEVLFAASSTDTDVIDFLRVLGERFPAHTNGVFDAWLKEFQSVDGKGEAGLRAALILDTPEGPRRECMVTGQGTYYDSLLRQVGFANAFADGTGFTPLAPEALLKAAPDVLFVVGFDRDPAQIAREWGDWMGNQCRTIVLAESWAYRPGPRMTELKRVMLAACTGGLAREPGQAQPSGGRAAEEW